MGPQLNETAPDFTLTTFAGQVSLGPVDLSVDVISQGGVDDGDYVRLYQIVDGGKEKLVGEVKGKPSETKTIRGTASGKRLTLVIRAKVSSKDEVLS